MVRWVLVLLTIALCAVAAALLTILLLKVVGLDEYGISVAAVFALMVCWLRLTVRLIAKSYGKLARR